ncbi:hypothetical protein T05_3765 [Trichinella murrelli]|uniref:Uncharacterized protein n=1 Tax=Trichinella murrelli TaxID=144512 RepID=A0A0V0TIT9_9BILA|nr:hypothetical protein T05_3765 [Trichinella murrelli]
MNFFNARKDHCAQSIKILNSYQVFNITSVFIYLTKAMLISWLFAKGHKFTCETFIKKCKLWFPSTREADSRFWSIANNYSFTK